MPSVAKVPDLSLSHTHAHSVPELRSSVWVEVQGPRVTTQICSCDSKTHPESLLLIPTQENQNLENKLTTKPQEKEKDLNVTVYSSAAHKHKLDPPHRL